MGGMPEALIAVLAPWTTFLGLSRVPKVSPEMLGLIASCAPGSSTLFLIVEKDAFPASIPPRQRRRGEEVKYNTNLSSLLSPPDFFAAKPSVATVFPPAGKILHCGD